jgi:hypothetical protein
LRPTEEKEGDAAFHEVRTIMELGSGLNGHPNIAHGGFVATMLDEVLGVLIQLNLERKVRRLREVEGRHPGLSCFTACKLFLSRLVGILRRSAFDRLKYSTCCAADIVIRREDGCLRKDALMWLQILIQATRSRCRRRPLCSALRSSFGKTETRYMSMALLKMGTAQYILQERECS